MASLADIVANIKDTNDLLKDNVVAQQRVFDLMDDAARKEKEARMDDLQSTKASKTKAVRGGASGFGGSFKEGLGLGSAFGAASSLIGGLLGKLTIPLLAAAAYAFDQIAFDGAGLKGIKEWGKNLIAGVIEKFDFMNILDDEQSSDIAKRIIKAAGPALIVALFSKKAGLILFLGKLFADFAFDKIFPEGSPGRKEMETEFNRGIESVFGLKVMNSTLFKIGAGLAGLLGLRLFMGALSMAFTGSIGLFAAAAGSSKRGGGKGLKDGLAKQFRGGFGKNLAAGLILYSMGSQIGDIVANATGGAISSSNFETALTIAITAAMINPKLGLIAIIVGSILAAYKIAEDQLTKAQKAGAGNLKQITMSAQTNLDRLKVSGASAADIAAADKALKAAQLAELDIMNVNRSIEPGQFTKVNSLEERKRILQTGFGSGMTNPDFLQESTGQIYKGFMSASEAPGSGLFGHIIRKNNLERDRLLNPYSKETEPQLFESFRRKAREKAKLLESSSLTPNANGANGQNVSAQIINGGDTQQNAYTFLTANMSLGSYDAALAGVMSSGDIKVYA